MRLLPPLFLLLPVALLSAACQDTMDPSLAPTDESSALDPSNFDVGLKEIASGLTSPIHLTEAPDGSGRLFVVDQVGQIRIIDADGNLLAEPFLDLAGRMQGIRPFYDERGLLGLAFHPDYAQNGRFFVYYSAPLSADAPAGWDHTSRISEFQASSSDPNRANVGAERILLQVDQPQRNHNGGTLAFGPHDGLLYISIGDGGGGGDDEPGHVEDWYADNAGGNAQNIEANLLGKILRIDVDGGMPYAIPADNPFVETDGLDEIYAYGFRNPYRFSFDRGGEHALLVGDAGQELWEEVSVVENGGNYGWNVKEGVHCFSTAYPNTSAEACPSTDESTKIALADPVIEYLNGKNPGGLGRTVVGGYVYRGSNVPQFRGRYIFGDFSRGFGSPDGSVFVASPRKSGMWHLQEVLFPDREGGRLGHFLKGFGQDLEGEIYLLTSDRVGPAGTDGRVYQLVGPGNRKGHTE